MMCSVILRTRRGKTWLLAQLLTVPALDNLYFSGCPCFSLSSRFSPSLAFITNLYTYITCIISVFMISRTPLLSRSIQLPFYLYSLLLVSTPHTLFITTLRLPFRGHSFLLYFDYRFFLLFDSSISCDPEVGRH